MIQAPTYSKQKETLLPLLKTPIFNRPSSDKNGSNNSSLNTTFGQAAGTTIALGSLALAMQTAVKNWGEDWLYKPLSMQATIGLFGAALAGVSSQNDQNPLLKLLKMPMFKKPDLNSKKLWYHNTPIDTTIGTAIGAASAIGSIGWLIPRVVRKWGEDDIYKPIAMHSLLAVLGTLIACISSKGNVQTDKNNQNKTLEDYASKLFPLEVKIKKAINTASLKKLGIDRFISSISAKQTIVMCSNLLIALGSLKLLLPALSPYLAIPLSLGAMQLANKGLKNPTRISLTAATAVALTHLKSSYDMPRSLIRPIMGLAVFLIENFKANKGNMKTIITKDNLFALGKLEALINTIPPLLNVFTKKVHIAVNESENPLSRFFGNIGVFTSEIVGLSAGFVAAGKFLDTMFAKFNLCKMDSPTRLEGVLIFPTCPLAQVAEVAEASSAGFSAVHAGMAH